DPDVEPLHRGGFRCRLCQITVANRPSLLSHLSGKRHRRLRCLRAERRAQEQRSLFVSGFPRGTEPARLRQHFRAFGDVATVVMDKEKGAFAIVELRDPAGRQRALDEPRHVLEGRRLRVRPREHRAFPRERPREPPGAPPAPPGLLQALGQAQDVSCSVVPYGSSVNGFDVHGCDLDLHLELGGRDPPREGNGDPQSPGTPNEDPQSPEIPNGDPQNPGTPNGDPKSRRTLNGDPPPNGSLSGDREPPLEGSLLGSEGSHLGCFLGDGEEPPSRGSLVGSEGSLLGNKNSILGSGGSLVLALVGAVLRRCVPGVRGVRAVPGARRPVVKFSHKQSGLAGDVCLDNRLALFNTRFLRLCADADPRVRPLGYAVRLWAGGQRLAGNRAGGGPLLTNYALTLLVVLFLQSRSPPVLPSVRRLQRLAGPRDRARVGEWDCSFPRDAAELEPSANGQSAASLLAEFFSYFGTLDLGGLLLSPLEGRALPCPPPETLGGLRPGPLTLQDPFELSHNVAANVTPRTASRFVRCCRDAARLCRGPEFLQKSRRGRPWGVMRLLQPGPGGNCGNSRGKFLIPVPLPSPGSVPRSRVCAAVGFVLAEVLGCGCEPQGTAATPGEPPPGAECHLEQVTGDSRGEFGAPGDEEELLLDPSEPPPGAECHLEQVTGDSRGEFGAPGDEEELLLGPSEPPAGAECHLEQVTGDSRGEFGAPGHSEPPVDPPGSEPRSRCHLGEAPGDPREESGGSGTAGKRRLPPEGVPDGAGVPPAKRPRLPSAPWRWSCCVRYRVWRGRRRLRRRLRARGGSGGAPDPEGTRGDQGPEGPGGAAGPGAFGGRAGPGGVEDLGGSPLALERAVTEAIVRGDTGTPPGPPPEPLLRFQLSAHPGGSRRDPQMLLRLQPEPDPPSPLFQEFFHFLRSFLPGMVRQRL
ncbi:STPAP polymerase, partial [Hirundo rustica]|nr:STPAP polymerase [Hirundo rustica]